MPEAAQQHEDRAGWVSLLNARKYHYIREGRSLCGRWGYFGSSFQGTDAFDTPGANDCVPCWRARRAELTATTEES